jgi:hypothetical protein
MYIISHKYFLLSLCGITLKIFRKSQAIIQYIAGHGKSVGQWHAKISFDVGRNLVELKLYSFFISDKSYEKGIHWNNLCMSRTIRFRTK